jgi:PAS domain S-box-containing protein
MTQEEEIKYLRERVAELEQSEHRAVDSLDRLFHSFDFAHAGILLEDENRKIVATNQVFCDIFEIPVSPGELVGADCSNSAEQSKVLFSNPSLFVSRVETLLKNKVLCLNEEMNMADGRTLERDYIPIFLNGKYSGHLWKYTDVTLRKSAEKLILNREAKFKGIIDNFHLGLLEVAPDGRIIRANESFCEMSGFSCEELHGKDGGDLLLDDVERERMKERNASRIFGEEDVYELRVFNKNRETRYWLVSAAPLLGDDGEVHGSIGIHWDITHMKELEFELKEARRKAEESSKAKAMFLANMSHEIRTPLNGIVGMAEQLAQSQLDADQRYFTDIMRSASSTLLSIINDVLDISKIESGKFSIETTPFNLNLTIRRTLSIFEEKAKQSNITLDIELMDDRGIMHLGDPHRLSQVLFNIVGNAIKFTQAGYVRVTSHLSRGENDICFVSFCVEDTGVGMDMAYLAKVFEAFSQEDASITRKFGGSGLGLSIARSIIQIMGGTIQIESEKGKGTRVDIRIPMRISNEKTKQDIVEMTDLQKSLKGLRVLAVEDNELNRMVLQVILKKCEVVVSIAHNGQEAIDQIQEKEFDIVLMDVQMPILDGLEATKYIREELKLTTPIIGLSANAMREEVEICKQAGMNDYLVKPYSERSLVEVMRKWSSAEKTNSTPSEINEESEELDLSMLKQYVGNDFNVLKDVVSGYLQHLPPQLDRLELALVGSDVIALRHELHQLKASMEIIGVRPEGLSFAGISNELKTEGLSAVAKSAIASVITKGKQAIVSLRKLVE